MKFSASLIPVLIAISCFAQTPPAFEVASVRLNQDGVTASPSKTPTSLTIRGVSFQTCVQMAWQMPETRVIGPAWLNEIHLDIAARTSAPVDDKQLFAMLQQLLADRMGLKAHVESREAPVYAITVSKGGIKFHASTTEGPMSGTKNKNRTVLERVSMTEFARILSQGFGRPFVDATGLTGKYDISIDATPYMTAPDSEHPTPMDLAAVAATALQEQLGLKVEARKDMIDMLVIDHAEKTPTEN